MIDFKNFKQVSEEEYNSFLKKKIGYDNIVTILKFNPDRFIRLDKNSESKNLIVAYENVYLDDNAFPVKEREYFIVKEETK